ncbi:ABC transporter permease [Lentilactobacillus curieae]|uniref:ABC transporter permease n=1 Tax=Lentilactobacillus curieae TaxID=1138822 RepID=A0A1S6QHI0_9LACO|nr:ABC transporter permease [Lentilactobacillus curieae]AQW21061.1 ABC transporter permease [Lentilactobacillus curieae]
MRILSITKRIIKEMRRDKRTLALMFVAPLFILTLMFFLFQQNSDVVAKVGVHNVPAAVTKQIKNKHIEFKHFDNKQSAKENIRNHDLDGYISKNGNQLHVTYQNASQTQAGIIKKSVQAALVKLQIKKLATGGQKARLAINKMQSQIKQISAQLPAQARSRIKQPQTTNQGFSNSTLTMKNGYLYGNSDSTFFSTMFPIFVGFVVFFFVFLISGISLLRERNTRTLDRLLATPVKRSEIIFGYICGYGLFAIVQTLIVVLYCIYGLQVQILGSIWLVLLICFLLALVALSIGLFVSTFAASEFQMMQFIPILVIPQIFFSGIIPVENMAGWLQVIAHIMPLYYGASALTDVIQKSATLSSVSIPVLILLFFFVVFTVLNVVGMRRYRKV